MLNVTSSKHLQLKAEGEGVGDVLNHATLFLKSTSDFYRHAMALLYNRTLQKSAVNNTNIVDKLSIEMVLEIMSHQEAEEWFHALPLIQWK